MPTGRVQFSFALRVAYVKIQKKLRQFIEMFRKFSTIQMRTENVNADFKRAGKFYF